MKDFAFGKMNYIMLAIAMVIIIVGFILMSGSGSAEGVFNADIFSARRIKVAPIVCFIGFMFMIVGIMYHPAEKKDNEIKGEE